MVAESVAADAHSRVLLLEISLGGRKMSACHGPKIALKGMMTILRSSRILRGRLFSVFRWWKGQRSSGWLRLGWTARWSGMAGCWPRSHPGMIPTDFFFSVGSAISLSDRLAMMVDEQDRSEWFKREERHFIENIDKGNSVENVWYTKIQGGEKRNNCLGKW